jgi:hypothetical protein
VVLADSKNEKTEGELMKLEDSDIRELMKGNYWFLINDTQIGICPKSSGIFMPSLLDRFINQNSDDKGYYWIPRKGNEHIVLEILQKAGDSVKMKPKVK